jgi:GTP diphosphokinase / guanosine-3',5'-bis(diphosphate) 3'-diphosphatase
MRGPMSTPARTPHQFDEQLRPLVDELLASLLEAGDDADMAAIERACAFAAERHATQERKSGEPYVVHPLGVARICAELRAETPVIVAALLHDTVEDTETTIEEIAA